MYTQRANSDPEHHLHDNNVKQSRKLEITKESSSLAEVLNTVEITRATKS